MTALGQTQPGTLWNKNFILWWLGSAQSAFGSALAGIALSFLVLEISGSAGAMGVNLALAMLPGLLSPLAGTLVDRIPLKLPLVAGDLARGVIVGRVGLWALSGTVPLGLIYALSLLTGLIGVLYGPAAGSLIPHLAPRDQLVRANGLLGTATQTAGLIGLVGGGLLVSRVGNAPALLIDALTFLVMGALLPFVNTPKSAASRERRPFLADLAAGFAHLRASRILTLVPVMGLFINASVAPMLMLLPKRMLDLGAGAAGFGTFEGCLTAGVVVGSALVAALGARLAPRTGIFCGLVGIGGALLLMATAGGAATLWAFGALLGLGMGLTNSSFPTLLMQLVEPEFRGRVFSFLGMVLQIGMPLTLLALAPFADKLAIGVMFTLAGGVTLFASLVWAVWGREHGPRLIPETVG